jgi:hypothetical protein
MHAWHRGGDHPDSFWEIVLGSGYRATVDGLSPEQYKKLHARLLGQLRSNAVTTLRTDVVFGTARKLSSPTQCLGPR